MNQLPKPDYATASGLMVIDNDDGILKPVDTFCYHRLLSKSGIWQMSGLSPEIPRPTDIRLHQVSRALEITFNNGARGMLPCEFLRVHSPSAEVQGHGNPALQTGKRDVNITAIEPIGHYAVKLVFSDGHDTGLYSWDYLYELLQQHDALWQQYLDRLAQAGGSRDADNKI